MLRLLRNLCRLVLLGCVAAGGAVAMGTLDAGGLLGNRDLLVAAGGALGVLWLSTELLARKPPAADAAPPPTGSRRTSSARPAQANPEAEAFLLRVQKLAASGQLVQLAKELPRPEILEPMLQQVAPAERPRLLIPIAQAHEAAKEYDAALLRAKQARALKPDSQAAREVLCRVAAAGPLEKFRPEDLYPAYKELAAGWKEEYAPLVLYALRAGLGRQTLPPRAVAQLWDLFQAFRRIDEVAAPFLAEVEEAVARTPAKADLMAIVARAHAASGNPAAALEAAREATAKTLDCPSVYKFLLEHHQKAGGLGELALHLQRLAVAGRSCPALDNAIRECDAAIRIAADVASKKAGAAVTPLEMGLGHLSKGDHSKAIAFLETAVARATAEQSSFIRILLARSLLKAGQAGPALEQLERADTQVLTLDQRYELAMDLETSGQLQAARKHYSGIVAVQHSYRDVEACIVRVDEKLSKDPQHLMEAGIAASLPQRFKSPRLAGQGGMGMVFRAHDSQTDHAVAIKVLSPLLAGDAEQKLRFLREATTLSTLDHPGVVKILDVGEKPVPYYAMEYLAGMTLGGYLKSTGPMDCGSVASLGGRIAESLGYCHDKGLIHRDIKPDNIFLDENGRVVLIDFGLVHVDAKTAITRTGAVMGTLAYMSPEQLGASPVTAATDIYALGVTLFEMATGRLPFSGDDVIGQVMTMPAPAPKSVVPTITDTMNATILKCLEKLPKRRFKSCAELEQALAAG